MLFRAVQICVAKTGYLYLVQNKLNSYEARATLCVDRDKGKTFFCQTFSFGNMKRG